MKGSRQIFPIFYSNNLNKVHLFINELLETIRRIFHKTFLFISSAAPFCVYGSLLFDDTQFLLFVFAGPVVSKLGNKFERSAFIRNSPTNSSESVENGTWLILMDCTLQNGISSTGVECENWCIRVDVFSVVILLCYCNSRFRKEMAVE